MEPDLLVFDQMMEGMFIRGVGQLLTADGKQALREAGFDVAKKALPAYPVAIWESCLLVAGKDVYPQLSPEDALRQLGLRFTEGYKETLVGRAIMPLVRIIGMKKALGRMTQSFRSGNNFMEGKVTEIGHNQVDVWISYVHHQPNWAQGMLEGGARLIGVREVTVDIKDYSGTSCHYIMRWS